MIIRRGKKVCFYCSRQYQSAADGPNQPGIRTRDHVIPQSRMAQFGIPRGTQGNVVYCCRECNERKANLTGEEYVMWLHGLACRMDEKAARYGRQLDLTRQGRKYLGKIRSRRRRKYGEKAPCDTPSPTCYLEAFLSRLPDVRSTTSAIGARPGSPSSSHSPASA